MRGLWEHCDKDDISSNRANSKDSNAGSQDAGGEGWHKDLNKQQGQVMGKETNQNRIIARWPRLLCVEDAAEYLNISPKTIRNGLVKSAPVPFPIKPKRFGKRVLFDIRDLDRFVDEMN